MIKETSDEIQGLGRWRALGLLLASILLWESSFHPLLGAVRIDRGHGNFSGLLTGTAVGVHQAARCR
jgi:hypothetical protein